MSNHDNGSNGKPSGDTPPQSPLFSDAPGATPPTIGKNPWSDKERAQIEKLKELIKEGRLGSKGSNDQGRPQRMLPYLLIRSFTGDNGSRPFNAVFWESPDIWTAVGDPATTPAIPPTHGGTLPVGQPNTVYAHVWNLGRAPVTGAVVSFYWFNPSLAIDNSHAHLIGQTRVDLGPRNSPHCHQLVKCPKPWVPVMENGGHECLIVRIWGFGDTVPDTQWSPWLDRHVAQRNVAVVQTVQQMQAIVSRFALTAMAANTRFELTQVGKEAHDAVQIVAPRLTLDPAIATRTLAHLDGKNLLTVKPTDSTTPRIMPHTLTTTLSPVAGLAQKVAPAVAQPAAAQPVGGAASLGGLAANSITATKLTVANANVAALVAHSALFDTTLLAGIKAAPAPAAGQAHVLRLAQYDGNQLVGGYTMVVGNAE